MTRKAGFIQAGITAVGILVVATVTIASAVAREPGFGHGRFGPVFDASHMAERLIRALDLDDAQRTEVRGIVDAAQPELRSLMDAVHDSREELRGLAEADTLDEQSLRTAADELGDTVAELVVVGVGVMNEVRAVLTPEQIEELESRMERLREGRGFGRRR